MKYAYIIVAGLLALLTANVYGEIYKYKDSEGHWQFSDKPPANNGVQIYGNSTTQNPDSAGNKDLKAELIAKFKPGTVIEKASLATVTIESNLSSGSGFFISEDGYLITNKHVIRPTETKVMGEMKTNLESTEKKYEKYKHQFAEEEETLNTMHKQLKQYEAEVSDSRDSESKTVAEERYQGYKKKYDKRLEHYTSLKSDFDKSRREFESKRTDFNIKSSISQLNKTFTIILKNSTKLSAHLVSINKDHDLALLKLDGYKTPSLPLNTGPIHQVMKVYAVGSPLGIRDTVTAGIITGTRDEYILTDAKILPGSSGGPLINEAGQVVGVNTARLSTVQIGEGFGLAINIDIVRNEYAQYMH
jgi:serine protease Do